MREETSSKSMLTHFLNFRFSLRHESAGLLQEKQLINATDSSQSTKQAATVRTAWSKSKISAPPSTSLGQTTFHLNVVCIRVCVRMCICLRFVSVIWFLVSK
ncbi:unnamed protein product, partial [Ceratitis capitata]